MRELYGHTGVGQLWYYHRLCPGLLLEWDDILIKLILLGVIGHIEQSEAYLSHTSVGYIIVTALNDTGNEFVGNRLASLIVEGEGTQELLLYCEVLHKLRWQLDEVPPYARSAKALETGICKHTMQ